MKRLLYFFASVAIVATVAAVTAHSQFEQQAQGTVSKQRSEERQLKHEERVKRRAERLAAYERHIDSIVMSHNFEFTPNSMQQLPAGPMRMLSNPSFMVRVWDNEADICIPYIKGYVPPYYYTIFNYSFAMNSPLVTEQTHDGWTVSFKSLLYSASEYTFTFEIYSSSGSTTLTISSPWYNAVQYNGYISQIY